MASLTAGTAPTCGPPASPGGSNLVTADIRTVGIARRLDLVTTPGAVRTGIDGEPHGRGGRRAEPAGSSGPRPRPDRDHRHRPGARTWWPRPGPLASVGPPPPGGARPGDHARDRADVRTAATARGLDPVTTVGTADVRAVRVYHPLHVLAGGQGRYPRGVASRINLSPLLSGLSGGALRPSEGRSPHRGIAARDRSGNSL